jgi:hypothetical protein
LGFHSHVYCVLLAAIHQDSGGAGAGLILALAGGNVVVSNKGNYIKYNLHATP